MICSNQVKKLVSMLFDTNFSSYKIFHTFIVVI